jgi:hypothetical protein
MTTNSKPDRDRMKALSCGMVSDLSRLLADQGFGEKPIDIVEALAFAMFIIADTYSLAKPEKEPAIAVIHGFYEDMRDYFINQVIIKDRQVADADEVQAAAAKFHDLSRDRFHAYGEKFQQDILDPLAMSCPITVSYFLDNLFIQPLNKQEKLQLVAAVSDKVLHYWAGCVQSFKK